MILVFRNTIWGSNMFLCDLKQDEKAIVVDYSNVSELVRIRLFQLGLKEKEEISVKRKMPLGGPYMIETCGQCIGIRSIEAGRMKVKLI